jgi:isopentenyldiphosphate isomerase
MAIGGKRMQTEKLKIFDEEKNPIGVATREEVHRLGYWHETFHCWFVQKAEDTDYLYLQLRSKTKRDYPNLLDITAAGHLLADETVQDGVREIKEEVGIDVSFEELLPLGRIEYCVITDDFIDKELAHTYLYIYEKTFEDFTLQDEVAGVVKVALNDFVDLWFGERETVKISGFEMAKNSDKTFFEKYVGREQFVPHEINFYKTVIEKIKEKI